eukprot:364463-Chlamydomonas_euryale.AAC.9
MCRASLASSCTPRRTAIERRIPPAGQAHGRARHQAPPRWTQRACRLGGLAQHKMACPRSRLVPRDALWMVRGGRPACRSPSGYDFQAAGGELDTVAALLADTAVDAEGQYCKP